MIHTYSNGTKHRISDTKIDLEPPMLGRPYILLSYFENSYEIKEILSMREGVEQPPPGPTTVMNAYFTL